jgi:hypothetical protein
MRLAKLLTALVASILAVAALGLFVGGGVLVSEHFAKRDADGYLTSPRLELTSDRYAVVSSDLYLTAGPADWWPADPGEVRIAVESRTDSAVFVGIGPADNVDHFLMDVARHEISRVEGTEVDYLLVQGERTPSIPSNATFWVASAEGLGQQSLEWDITRGEWAIVVMNADGSPGVEADVEAGVRIDLLLAIGVGLVVGGVVLGALAAALLLWALRSDSANVRPVLVGDRVPAGSFKGRG